MPRQEAVSDGRSTAKHATVPTTKDGVAMTAIESVRLARAGVAYAADRLESCYLAALARHLDELSRGRLLGLFDERDLQIIADDANALTCAAAQMEPKS
jgi:hypothetical protein